VPGKTSLLGSAHFTEEDYTRPLNLGVVKMKRELKRSRDNCDEEVSSRKSREQRMVS